jgi:hypothetical protein
MKIVPKNFSQFTIVQVFVFISVLLNLQFSLKLVAIILNARLITITIAEYFNFPKLINSIQYVAKES